MLWLQFSIIIQKNRRTTVFGSKKTRNNEKQTDKNRHKRNRPKKGLSVIIMLVVIIGTLLTLLVGFITDWMWFKDLDYLSVFWKQLITEIKIAIPVFIISALLMRFYLSNLKSGYFRKIESHEIANPHKLNVVSWVLAVVFALAVSFISAKGTWFNMLQAMHSTNYDLRDPIFGIDVGFYIFKLDWLGQINEIVILAIIGMVVITLFYYLYLLSVRTPDIFNRDDYATYDENSSDITRNISGNDGGGDESKEIPFENGNDNPFRGTIFEKIFNGEDNVSDTINKKFKKRKKGLDVNNRNLEQLMEIASGKLIALGVVFYLMLGVDFFLKQFELLHSHNGTVYGAGFTDVNIKLWVLRAIVALSVVGAITFAIHIKKGNVTKLVKIPVIMIAVYVIGTGASIAVQSLVVSPDEINKESKYLKNNIEYTRHAYGLENIRVATYKADDSLDAQALKENEETIGNIRINDYLPVQDFYNQTQSIRQYYRFNDVDIDRYMINGMITQTYLAAREIDEEKISDTWINKHLKYTHGYGVAVSQVDTVTSSGQPDVIEGNIPPETNIDEIAIKRPEIYFGELTNDYVIVNTKEKEFDYPDGSENRYSEYDGKAGVKLNFLNRLLFAIKEGNIKILVSSNINSSSRIIYVRNVVDRVQKIMPYLKYESDPYMTIVNGKLYWILDAYTTSSNYPYSEPFDGKVNSTNYIRNSVKVIIDAYDGTTDFYVVDKEDPIAVTYQKIYPELFKSYDKLSEEMKTHLRYPNNLFKIQAGVYSKYHMDDVKVFYQKEDLWDISHQIYGTEDKEMDPSYYVFNLPDTKNGAEFINMVPFTPKSKQNLTAIMMARNDGENYGELIVYTMPKNKTIYGPMQIEAQIDQNTEISKEFSLWDSSGSKYKRGDLFVIPIGTSLMYVEPVYLEASNQAIPEVKRVIVAYQDRIAYESTLADALVSLFGGENNSNKEDNNDNSSAGGTESTKSLIEKAQKAYEDAVKAQQEGNWESYGKHLKELERYLGKLNNQNN